jgi:TRAP transporter 4TM/12TM fusion protein
MSNQGIREASLGFEEPLEHDPARTRNVWERTAAAVALALGTFHLWSGYAGGFPFVRQRSIHLAGALTVLLLALAARPSDGTRGHRLGRVVAVLALGVTVAFFTHTFLRDIAAITRMGRASWWELLWGIVVVLIAFELCRRVIGAVLPALVLGIAAYLLVATHVALPGSAWVVRVRLADMLHTTLFTTNGLFGSITGVSAGVVASFLVFGAMLGASGGAQSFLALARFFVGRYRGGPGKVSLVTSAFFGTVSGSAVANVVVDGVFNIPLMKRSGFRPEFAAAVEATTSSGGQLVPPVMGAAAFIMAEFLGIPYTTIVLAAIVPILLFYVGLFISIHIEAVRNNLPGIPKDQLPKLRGFLNREFFGSFAIPIAVLLFVLYSWNRSLLFASWCATMTVIAYMLTGIRAPLRARFARVVAGLRRGGEDISRIVAIVVVAQILISLLGLSGIASRVANELATASIPASLGLVFLGLVVVILGFGVPTAAAYVLAASIATPIFTSLGIDRLAGHMFILYLTVYANITPPVMPATYAAVAIARADVMRSGVLGTRLLAPALLVPFAFALTPEIMLSHGTWVDSVVGGARMSFGMGVMACGLGLWFLRPLRWFEAGPLAFAGALFAWPGLEPTLIGGGLALLVGLPVAVGRWRLRGAAVPSLGGAGLIVASEGAVEEVRGQDFEERAGRIAAVLAGTDVPGLRFGLGEGDTLVVSATLGPTTVVATLAAVEFGAWTVLHAPGKELPEQHASADVVLVNEGRPQGAQASAFLTPVEVDILAAGRHAEPSASAGHRRVVHHLAGQDVSHATSSKAWDGHLSSIAAAFEITTADRVLVLTEEFYELPMALLIIGATLGRGGCVVVSADAADPDPARWLELVELTGTTAAVVSRRRLEALVAHCEDSGASVPTALSALIHVSDGMPEDLKRAAIRVFGPILIQYHTAPGLAGATVITCEEWLERPASIGRTLAYPDEDVHVLGDQGERLGPGAVGTIAYRVGASADTGQAAGGLAVADAVEGYVHTGWRGYRDHEGYLFLVQDAE